MSNTERDAKDFKWHHGQSYVWGVSIMDLHERKTTQLTGYLWPRCDRCAGRSSSGSLAKLGRYPSSLRPHLFGFSRLPGDGDIHPQHRGGREDEAASILASAGKPRGRITVGVPAKTGSPGDGGRRGFYFHSDIDSPKKAVTFDPIKCGYALLPTTNFLSLSRLAPSAIFPRRPDGGENANG